MKQSVVLTIEEAWEAEDMSFSVENIARYTAESINVLSRQYLPRVERKDGRVHPSGWNCGRKKAAEKHGIEAEPFDFRTISTFATGDMHENLIRVIAYAAGVPLRKGAEQVRLITANGSGRVDDIVDWTAGPSRVVEYKSMSGPSWDRFVKVGGERVMLDVRSIAEYSDVFGYRTQSNAYVYAAFKEGLIEAPETHIVAINKLNLSMAERVYAGDPEHARLRADEFNAVMESSSPWDLPAEALEYKAGKAKLGLKCSYCQYKEPCWLAQGFALKRGSKWDIFVEKEG